MIRRWHWLTDGPYPRDVPFVASARMLDTPETVASAIRNAPPNCVAVTVRPYGGARFIGAVERAARRKGLRVLWMTRKEGPFGFPADDLLAPK